MFNFQQINIYLHTAQQIPQKLYFHFALLLT